MKVLLLAIWFCLPSVVVRAQAAAVDKDLEDRLEAARAATLGQDESQVRAKLEAALAGQSTAVKLTLRWPDEPAPEARWPAVIHLIVHPEDEPEDYDDLLVKRGFFVATLDLSGPHNDPAFLRRAQLPQQIFQHAVRRAIQQLSTHPGIDPNRIAIAGSGFAVLTAAFLNPTLAAAVLRSPVPDPSDPCLLIPGLAHIAQPQTLLGLLAPRPVMASGLDRNTATAAIDQYRLRNAGEHLMPLESAPDPEQRAAMELDWIAGKLQATPTMSTQRLETRELPAVPAQPQNPPTTLETLGAPLPEGRMTMALQIAREQDIELQTQANVKIPVTVYRPGDKGGDHARGVLFAIHDEGRGKLEKDAIVKEARNRGWLVYTIDPRGIGEMRTPETNTTAFTASLLLGEYFVWRQATDLARVIRFLGAARPHRPSRLYASGKLSGIISLYTAAAVGTGYVEEVLLENTPEGRFDFDLALPLYAVNFTPAHLAATDLIQQAKPKILPATAAETLPW